VKYNRREIQSPLLILLLYQGRPNQHLLCHYYIQIVLPCLVISFAVINAEQYYGIGIFGYNSDITNAGLVSLDTVKGSVMEIGFPFYYTSQFWCTNVFIESQSTAIVLGKYGFLVLDSDTGDITLNGTYDLGQDFTVQSAAWDVDNEIVVAMINIANKMYLVNIDPSNGDVVVLSAIPDVTPLIGCVGDFDSNSAVYYGSRTGEDISAFDSTDGQMAATYDFSEEVIDINIDQVTGDIFVLTNDIDVSNVWYCIINVDDGTLICEVLSTLQEDYIAIFPTNVYYDQDQGYLYVFLSHVDNTNNVIVFTVDGATGRIVESDPIDDFDQSYIGVFF